MLLKKVKKTNHLNFVNIKMFKYVTKNYWEEGEWQYSSYGNSQTRTVVENTDKPINTGLLDKDGNELYRLPEKKNPIGYIW